MALLFHLGKHASGRPKPQLCFQDNSHKLTDTLSWSAGFPVRSDSQSTKPPAMNTAESGGSVTGFSGTAAVDKQPAVHDGSCSLAEHGSLSML